MFTAGPISEDDFFNWSCLISGPEDTPFEGGVFQANLSFPRDYPLSPPKMKFDPPLFHPNIYANGDVCISILHAPGDDPNSYESASERWSPVQSVEKILLSVISMLAGTLPLLLQVSPPLCVLRIPFFDEIPPVFLLLRTES